MHGPGDLGNCGPADASCSLMRSKPHPDALPASKSGASPTLRFLAVFATSSLPALALGAERGVGAGDLMGIAVFDWIRNHPGAAFVVGILLLVTAVIVAAWVVHRVKAEARGYYQSGKRR